MNIQLGQRNAPEHILDCKKKITKEEKNMNETKKYVKDNSLIWDKRAEEL